MSSFLQEELNKRTPYEKELDEQIIRWVKEDLPGSLFGKDTSSDIVAFYYRLFVKFSNPSIEDFEKALYRCGFELICREHHCQMNPPEKYYPSS